MARIPKTKVYNPQKASAYVGKGVLRNGGDTITSIKGAITPVPNGPLIKKDGTSLKNGGNIKPKASNVSKKLGSAKKSIGNMRFAKKKK